MKERIDIALRYFGIGYISVFVIINLLSYFLTRTKFGWNNMDLWEFLNEIDNVFYFNQICDNTNTYFTCSTTIYFPFEFIMTILIVFFTRWLVFGKVIQK
tara:strand:- start:574 stop:873 length:300 start_codon:yes stop_codon:yes gene_type:complete